MNKKGQMDLSEILESPGFWILGGGAIIATVLGWTMSKSWTGHQFPIWQLLIIIVVELIAAAFFATRD